MLKKSILGVAFVAVMCLISNPSQAQFKINTKAIGKAAASAAENTAGDLAANKVCNKLVEYMDKNNHVAAADSKYTKRLDSLVGKYAEVNGIALNYKVYESSEVNVLACANGSIRVYSAAMDTLTNDELLAVIANQIGHIANKDSRDALLKVASADNAGKATNAQLDKMLSLSGDKLGSIANELIQVPFTVEQETAADNYAYNFLKSNGEKVAGLVSALKQFEEMAQTNNVADGEEVVESIATKYISVHPENGKRAEAVKAKAVKDGLM